MTITCSFVFLEGTFATAGPSVLRACESGLGLRVFLWRGLGYSIGDITIGKLWKMVMEW